MSGIEEHDIGEFNDINQFINVCKSYMEKGTRIIVKFTLKIYGSEIQGKALIDSGASCDTVSFNFLQKANIGHETDRHRSRTLYDFQDRPCHTIGVAKFGIQIGKIYYDQEFTVINSQYSPEIILGMPFFRRYGLEEHLKEGIQNLAGADCFEDSLNE